MASTSSNTGAPENSSERTAAQPLTENTPTTAKALRQLLKQTRDAGVAISIQEVSTGACGVSAPILGHHGFAIASIGISGPLARISEAKRQRFVPLVKAAAREVTELVRQQLTASGPPDDSQGRRTATR